MNNDIKHQMTLTELKLFIENAQLRGENKRQRELLRCLHVDWLKYTGGLSDWQNQLDGYVKAAFDD